LAIVWMLVGAFLALVVQWALKQRMGVLEWILGALGALDLLLGVEWTAATIREGEPRAVAVGLVIFGALLVIDIVIIRFLLSRKATASGASARA